MQQMINEGLVAWVDAAGLALLAIIAGLLVYKALVYLIGRFAQSASVGQSSLTRRRGPLVCRWPLSP